MAIEKHTTKAIIVDAFDQGEHDRVFVVFTREFGLIKCHAKSVRKLESKLRAHILPRSCSLVTLVLGREVWRLVGAEKETVNEKYIHEVVYLIKRFVRGEGKHTELYDRLVSFLEKAYYFDEATSRLLLYYLVLVELGYVDARVIGVKNIKEYYSFSVLDLHTHLLLKKNDVRTHINNVLKEIQL